MPSVDTNLEGVDKPLRFDFDAAADTYDQWYETAEGAMYDRLEKKAIERYLPKKANGKKLLEVGCGTGHWSQFFSSCGFEVTGVDISEPMIRIAQSKDIPIASFQVADGHFLPFDDNSFDVTAAITTLEFVHDAELVLQEMARCTRKTSGQLLIGVLNALARLNRKRQQRPELPYANALLFSPEQLGQLLEPYGQTHISVVGFVPVQRWLLPLSPLTDMIFRLVRCQSGAFIAAEVRL